MSCKNNCCKKKCCCKQNYIICPPIPPPIEFKKAIALIEPKNLSIDQYLLDSLYFSWYQDNSLPKFPVIETDATVQNNLELLNKYYDEGYRIFFRIFSFYYC